MITKSASFEITLSKKDIEAILRKHFEEILSKEDSDFKDSNWCQDDFTYSFKDGQPSIDVVIILDSVKMKKPR
jgi:hypothetical protein